jgi:hypothetical protein
MITAAGYGPSPVHRRQTPRPRSNRSRRHQTPPLQRIRRRPGPPSPRRRDVGPAVAQRRYTSRLASPRYGPRPITTASYGPSPVHRRQTPNGRAAIPPGATKRHPSAHPAPADQPPPHRRDVAPAVAERRYTSRLASPRYGPRHDHRRHLRPSGDSQPARPGSRTHMNGCGPAAWLGGSPRFWGPQPCGTLLGTCAHESVRTGSRPRPDAGPDPTPPATRRRPRPDGGLQPMGAKAGGVPSAAQRLRRAEAPRVGKRTRRASAAWAARLKRISATQANGAHPGGRRIRTAHPGGASGRRIRAAHPYSASGRRVRAAHPGGASGRRTLSGLAHPGEGAPGRAARLEHGALSRGWLVGGSRLRPGGPGGGPPRPLRRGWLPAAWR